MAAPANQPLYRLENLENLFQVIIHDSERVHISCQLRVRHDDRIFIKKDTMRAGNEAIQEIKV